MEATRSTKYADEREYAKITVFVTKGSLLEVARSMDLVLNKFSC